VVVVTVATAFINIMTPGVTGKLVTAIQEMLKSPTMSSKLKKSLNVPAIHLLSLFATHGDFFLQYSLINHFEIIVIGSSSF